MGHTNGKWTIAPAKHPDATWYKHIVCENGATIALILDRKLIGSKDTTENQCNTDLIVSAPQMLEALEEAYYALTIANKENPCKGYKDTIDKIEKAIRAAQGGGLTID